MTTSNHQRGAASFFFLSIAGVLLFGFLALAVDFGRLYLVQGELQTAADAAALAAASRLTGTADGATHAADQVTATFDNTDANDNRFNLRQHQIGLGATDLLTSIQVSYFATRVDALANSNAVSDATARYARVEVNAETPVLFPQFINPAFGPRQGVTAVAVAGISLPMCSACGIDSLAVVDPSGGSDPVNFGFVPGGFYTLYLTTSLQTISGCSASASTPSPLTGTESVVEYGFLNHVPTGPDASPDGVLFELGAGGMQKADVVTIGNAETAVADAYLSCPGQDILCGLNARFGVDPSTNVCGDGTLAGGEFAALAPSFTPDTDGGGLTYSAGFGLQDFATEYDGSLRRILTVPVVDSAESLTVLNFVQFLIETSDTVEEGIDPSLTTGAFRAQYITTLTGSSPVPLRCGGVGGSCNVQFGVGRTVLHCGTPHCRPAS